MNENMFLMSSFVCVVPVALPACVFVGGMIWKFFGQYPLTDMTGRLPILPLSISSGYTLFHRFKLHPHKVSTLFKKLNQHCRQPVKEKFNKFNLHNKIFKQNYFYY